MEAFTFAVSTQVDFPIHVKMYAIMSLSLLQWEASKCIRALG